MKLDETNFLLYAAKYYDNPQCFDTVEFYEDLKHFKYIKRLFNKYRETGDLKERLILNHLIIIYNMFGAEPATRMLFFKLRGYESYLKPFLVFMNYMPEIVREIGIRGENVVSTDVSMDQKIVDTLRKI